MAYIGNTKNNIKISIDLFNEKKYIECLEIVKKILTTNPDDFLGWKLAGACYGYLDDKEKSIGCFKKCISLNKRDAETYFNLAMAYKDNGENKLSIECYKVAIKLNENYYAAYTNLANLYSDILDFDNAEILYKKILNLNPKYINALLGYAKLLKILKRENEFDEVLKKLSIISPNNPDILNNLANGNYALGNYLDANIQYQEALKLQPNNIDYLTNYAIFLSNMEKKKEAEILFHRVLKIDNKNLKSFCYLGSLNFEKRDHNQAKYYFNEALKISEFNEHANVGMAIINYTVGNCPKAEQYLQKAIEFNSKAWQARWLSMVMQFPSVQDGTNTHEKNIIEFIKKIDAINSDLENSDPLELFKAVGMQQPYYIAYSEYNNKLALSKYGDLSSKVMERWRTSHNIKLNKFQKLNANKIKIGVVSDQIRYHSVWNAFLKGIITQVDKSRFEVHIFYTKSLIDSETQIAKNNSQSFHYGNKSLQQWAELIITTDLDILFYPEIGMGVMPFKLACMRLCDKQITSWGHPETSGLPTMDYFISSDFLEDKASDNYYREKLVKLSNLGSYYTPISVEYPDELDIKYTKKNDFKRLLCLGAPNKYMPEYDFIFVEIIKKIDKIKFLFMQDANGRHAALLARLKKLFILNNLNITNYIELCPHDMNRHDFSAVMKNSDLMLDSIGFSGFNTAMQSIECLLPIVTKNSPYMRGRNASAILKKMDLPELIVESDQDFINLVVKLISNKEFYDNIKNQMLIKKSKLYNDISVIRDFENKITSIVRGDL